MTVTQTEYDVSTIEKIVGEFSIACEGRLFHEAFQDCESPADWIVDLSCPNNKYAQTILLSDRCLTVLKNFEFLIGIKGWICPCTEIHTTAQIIQKVEPLNG